MKISTKKGDFGQTDFAKKRVKKSDYRIECLGQLDSCIAEGILLAAQVPSLRETCQQITEDLNLLCSILAGYQPKELFIGKTQELERKMNVPCSTFNFIYPYENVIAAKLNHLRTTVRNVERSLCRLHDEEPLPLEILSYMNRLSDFWFILCCKEIERTEQL